MRPILIWISLEHPWGIGLHQEVTYVGAGYPWLLLGLLGCAWVWWKRSTTPLKESLGNLGLWMVLGIFVHALFPLFKWSALPINGYGFMLFLGFACGGWLAARRAERSGMDPTWVWDVGLWIFLAGIFGARLFYCLQYPQKIFGGKQGLQLLLAFINLPSGGIVLYGGVIGGAVAFFAFCHRKRISPLKLADVIAPSVFVGLMFGRIGCLLYGCCYGDRCTLPWGITFPKGSITFDALLQNGFVTSTDESTFPLHPTQIYSAIDALLIAVLLTLYFPRRSRDGAVLAMGWIIYPITRFMVEFLRGDEIGQFGTSLTISQWISMGLFASGLLFWLVISRQPTIGIQNSPSELKTTTSA